MTVPSGYVWRARVAPVILATLPPTSLAIIAAAWLPGAQRLWALVGAAIAVLAAELGRDGGRRREASVWASWGGPPTTRMLRHRDSQNPAQTARRHRLLRDRLELELPTEEQEHADPVSADLMYETAVAALRHRTHAHRSRFPLVHAENASYGFRRNLVGLKPHAMIAAAFTAIACVVAAAALLSLHRHDHGAALPLLLPFLLSVAALLVWRRASDAWVKPVADAYADRLLDAVETLPVDPPGAGR